MPKVSICIPTYNTARYLPEAIESVMAQDFEDYELVICDNASTDATSEICRSYTDPRIRYLRFDEQTNQSGNFNRCLKAAQGEFVTLLHADDFLLPGFISDRVGQFEQYPEVGLIFGAVEIVNERSAQLVTKAHWAEERFFKPGELLDSLLMSCIISPPSLMVRKLLAELVGPFRTDLTWGHDWEWTLRLAEKSAAYYSNQPMAAYRVHDASGTAEILSAAKNGHQERRILQETFARLSGQSARLRKVAFQSLSLRHMYFAEQALLDGQRAVTRNNLRYAALSDPKLVTRPTFWALLIASVGPVEWYTRYRMLRNAVPTSGDRS
jgi:glycosyltransferase involved in cell wall biosynthesis